MNKADLIAEVAAKSGATSAETERVLNGFRDVVAMTVSMGEDVSYPGLGKFSRVSRSERTARNPRTGESVLVPPSNAPKFTASSKLKAIVAGNEPAPA